jgi:hypothetical protein
MCPDTTAADVDAHTAAFRCALECVLIKVTSTSDRPNAPA